MTPSGGQLWPRGAAAAIAAAAGGVPILRRATPTTSDPTLTGSGTVNQDPSAQVIPQMSITATFLGGPCLLLFSGDIRDSLTGIFMSVAARQDSVQMDQSVKTEYGGTASIMALTHGVTPSAGSHTFDITWRHSSTSGTLTAIALRRSFCIVEFAA